MAQTRVEHPFPLFATFANSYRQCNLCVSIYIHVYECLAVCMFWHGRIDVPALIRSASRLPVLRHLLPDGHKTAPLAPVLTLLPRLAERCVSLMHGEIFLSPYSVNDLAIFLWAGHGDRMFYGASG